MTGAGIFHGKGDYMTPQEYIEATARTWKTENPHTHYVQIAHAALGVAGECSELIEEKRRSRSAYLDVRLSGAPTRVKEEAREVYHDEMRGELGDVWYYLIILHRLLGHPFDFDPAVLRQMSRDGDKYSDLMRCGGAIAEHAKGFVFLEKEGSREKLIDKLGEMACRLHDIGMSEFNLRTPDVWAANIAKLENRYPNGFEKGGGVR